MTTHPLTLDGVSFRLADGRPLFQRLDFSFETGRIGLVGANGVGKSVLGRLLARLLAPQEGRCGGGSTHHVAALAGSPVGTVAELAGVAPVLSALDRIAAGSVDVDDFNLAEGQWDLRERLRHAWNEAGLPHDLRPEDDAARLSGGQVMQVALAGAFTSRAEWLVLDEPSNHLDARQRDLLLAQLERWKGGVLLISHDRALLEHVPTIIELDGQGLHRYPGPWSVFAAARQARRAAADARLQQARLQHRRQQRQARDLHDRTQQRLARGRAGAREANEAPILLGLQAQRAQASAGRAHQAQQARVADTAAALRAASQQVHSAPRLAALTQAQAAGARRILQLDSVVLPHGLQAPLDLTLMRGARIALSGDNGSGKSTLLRVLAGHLRPSAGMRACTVPVALLDQSLRVLPAASSVLQTIQQAAPARDPAALRTALALLGLDATHIQRPAHTLSAGERLKGALACALHAEPAPGLLLLDEPGNGLDLAALEALDDLLAQYTGTLVVASHDPHVLQALRPTHHLHAGQDRWQLALEDAARR